MDRELIAFPNAYRQAREVSAVQNEPARSQYGSDRRIRRGEIEGQ
jgi:hypothetical protein